MKRLLGLLLVTGLIAAVGCGKKAEATSDQGKTRSSVSQDQGAHANIDTVSKSEPSSVADQKPTTVSKQPVSTVTNSTARPASRSKRKTPS